MAEITYRADNALMLRRIGGGYQRTPKYSVRGNKLLVGGT
jgi:hypothetical protein